LGRYDSNDVLLQIGKVGDNEFTMDIRHPISILQGFGAVLALFENSRDLDSMSSSKFSEIPIEKLPGRVLKPQLPKPLPGNATSTSDTAAEIPTRPPLVEPYLKPAPPGELLQYEITRSSSFFGYPSFKLAQAGKFVLAARKRKKALFPSYVISRHAESTGVNSASVIGNMVSAARQPFGGMSFVVQACLSGTEEESTVARDELGYVQFSGKQEGHTRFAVTIPSLDDEGFPNRVVAPEDASLHSALQHLSQSGSQYCQDLCTKAGTLNSLDFGDRASINSCKNVQVVLQGDDSEVLLQIGKVGDNNYTMDIRHPLSVLQGFGLVLALFENGNDPDSSKKS